MDNVEFLTDFQGDEFAKIDRGNNEYTTMPKATYDEQQAEHFTPNV
jgi:hypothetical protein